ncbi:MAG TPA: endospore germination permease [Thermaerobacter sp.]
MRTEQAVTVRGALTVVVNIIIGIGILTLPREVATKAGPNSVVATLLGAVPVAVALAALNGLAPWMRRRRLEHGLESLVGRWAARLLLCAYCVYFLLFAAVIARAFAEVVNANVLRNTPVEAIMIPMLFAAVYVVHHRTVTLMRAIELTFPVLVATLVLLALATMGRANLIYVRPQPALGLGPLLQGLGASLFAYSGYGVYLFLLPELEDRPRRHLPWLVAATVGLIYSMVVFSAVATFGTVEVQRITWPTIELVKVTQIPGRVLERLESAFLAVWVTAVFTTVAPGLFAAAKALQALLGLKEHRVLAPVALPVLYVVALLPPNFAAVARVLTGLGWASLVLEIAVPVLLWAVATIRGWGRRRAPGRGAGAASGRRAGCGVAALAGAPSGGPSAAASDPAAAAGTGTPANAAAPAQAAPTGRGV